MKTKFTLLTLLMLFVTSINFAQTSATASGIAIQGIARDNNNTARINTTVPLTFRMYFINQSNAEVLIGTETTVNLPTDNFGVFSHVIEPGAANNAIIANNQTYLRIKEGGTTLSDEKLKHVPYAIAANNGVPTGSIMPFVGTTAPTGWVLCNGQSLAGVTGSENLIVLIGNNAPDLRGMFLRGAGTNTVSGYETNVGPTLNTRQQDDNLSHTHTAGTLVNSIGGSHQHPIEYSAQHANEPSGTTNYTHPVPPIWWKIPNLDYGSNNLNTKPEGNHTHTITGSTASQGTESRPVNYGVNYIIKL